jgi:hypothetical protein
MKTNIKIKDHSVATVPKSTTTYEVGNPDSCFGHAQICVEVNEIPILYHHQKLNNMGRHGHDRMVVGVA